MSFTQINLPEALARVGGDAELLREVAALLLDENRKLLVGLHVAVQNRDARAIESQAHTLKGCVGNFGAEQLQGLAAELERKGREREMAGVEELLAEVEKSTEEFNSELTVLAEEG